MLHELFCTEDIENTSEIQQPKEQVAFIEGNWSNKTSLLPEQFSFIDIATCRTCWKMWNECSGFVEKPLEEDYKFFYENYLFGVWCLLNGSEVHVKGKCYRSQRRSDRPHDVMVILSLTGNVKVLVNEDTSVRTNCCPCCLLGCANWETFVVDTKCFRSYWPCNHIKAFYLPQSWNMHRKPSIETPTYLSCPYPEISNHGM